MQRWKIDRVFFSEEEAEGMLGEWLDVRLHLDYLENDWHGQKLLETLEEDQV